MFNWLKDFLGINDAGKQPPGPPPLPPGAERIGRDVLVLSVPTLHPNVERISDKRYGCLLQWPLSEAQYQPPKRTWFPKIFFHSRGRMHKLVLDDMGRRTVELIDGRRSIAQIADVLRIDTGHSQQTMETAVLSFVSQLARKNAVSLARDGKK